MKEFLVYVLAFVLVPALLGLVIATIQRIIKGE